MTKEILKKFNHGDALSDDECRQLARFFRNLYDSLCLMGPEYALAARPVYHSLTSVENYLIFRNLKP